MFGWLTFYHQGHEVAEDFKPYMTELQLKIQKVSSLLTLYFIALKYMKSIRSTILKLITYISTIQMTTKLLCAL